MKCQIFGDNFVGPFMLIDDDDININVYKERSIADLLNDSTNIKKDISEKVNLNRDCCQIFGFGNVDLHILFYKYYFANKEYDFDSAVSKYISFVASLNADNKNKYVLSMFPSPLSDKQVIPSLESLNVDVSGVPNDKIIQHGKRFARYKLVNRLLKKYCKDNGVNFIDMSDSFIKKDGTIKPEFINKASDTSISLLWEPQLETFVKNFKKCGLEIKLKEDLDLSLNKYIICKKHQLTDMFKEN